MTDGYGLLQPRITPTLPAEHEARRSSRRIFAGSAGIDPYAVGRLRRLPGPVPGGQLHRQGDLRRRCVRVGDARSGAGEHAAEPRPVRRCLRPRRPGDRRRAVRRVPVELPGRHAARQHRWARGDWQLLPWITGRAAPQRPRPQPEPDRRQSADGRWSTTCAERSPRRSRSATLVAAWTIPSASAGMVDRAGRRVVGRARRAAGGRRADPAPQRHLEAQPRARRRRRRRRRRGAGRARTSRSSPTRRG